MPGTGDGLLSSLGAPKAPPIEWLLIELLNDIDTLPGDVVLVLDDYHAVDAVVVDEALAFLLDYSKRGVSNRRMALRRAEDLELL